MPRRSVRQLCESLPQINMKFLRAGGYLKLRRRFEYGCGFRDGGSLFRVRANRFVADIEYDTGDGRREQRVNFTETRPPFGGIRQWFECPGCKRRCDVLYLSQALLCRVCLGLDYQSERTLKWRPHRHMERIRKKLKAFPANSVFAPCPERPPWGNNRIYDRLKTEYEAALDLQHEPRLPPGRNRWR